MKIKLAFFLLLSFLVTQGCNNVSEVTKNENNFKLHLNVIEYNKGKLTLRSYLEYLGDKPIKIQHPDPLVLIRIGDTWLTKEIMDIRIEKELNTGDKYNYSQRREFNIELDSGEHQLYGIAKFTLNGEKKEVKSKITISVD